MRLDVYPDARAEIVEAADWYDQRSTGLGDDFLAEVGAGLAAIVEQPHAWPLWPGAPPLEPPLQRYLLARFRYYAIAFQHFDERVLVLSVVHASRRPFYWTERVTS